MYHKALTTLCTALLLSTPSLQAAQQASDSVDPQVVQGTQAKQLAEAKEFMLATANPHATQAGYDILKAGGSAIDAAVAVQLMLGLVEPQSSGLGGGAFMLYWDAKKQELVALDGRETAPQAATGELFLDEQGEPLKFWDAVVGGLSVGTPGTVALLAEAHQRYGSMPWADLFQSSIQVAEMGFVVTPHMAKQIAKSAESLARFPETKDYFFTEDDQPLPAGYLRENPAYADTLRKLAEQGAAGFYQGEIAQAIVETVKNAEGNPGYLALQDLADYQVKQRKTVCVEYREHDVCGMGPPTSGGMTMGQILGMLGHYDLKDIGESHPHSWRLIGDASRLAFADRGLYMADEDFVDVPVDGLLDPLYLAQRAKLLQGDKALEQVEPGNPPGSQARAHDESIEFPSTSHFVIVDAEGSVVSMTTTIENGFGSRLMTKGFLLNNELTDFSFRAEKDGKPVANRVEPGKRPRSSMSPTIVMKQGKPYMAIGSPGGSRIIGYTTRAIIAHLDWGYDIQQAINRPHRDNRFGTYTLEEGTEAVNIERALKALGYEVEIKAMNSGLHGIVINENGLQGGADPRRDGTVKGR